MPETETWAKIRWTDRGIRRTFLVKSVRGGPVEEFVDEAAAGSFARQEDDLSIREHDARHRAVAVEAVKAPGEPADGSVIMQAKLPDNSPVFFGVDATGKRITSPDRYRSAVDTLLGRSSQPGPRL
jgi:hypothetical protein